MLPLPKASTTTPSCSGRARSSSVPSSPTITGTSATRAREPAGLQRGRAGARGGASYDDHAVDHVPDRCRVRRREGRHVGRMHLDGGLAGEDPAVEHHHRARPALAGLAATRAASSRLRGPSQPSSLDVRMAPVIATGTDRGSVRASR